MTIHVEAKLAPGCPWLPAILTTERAESSYGQPVLVIEGEGNARGPAEVYAIRPLWIAADRAEEREILTAAKHAGYCVLFKVSREPVDPENPIDKESPMTTETTTPTTTPNALDQAYLDAGEALDEMYCLACDLGIESEMEICGPEDGCFISLNFANVDLDPAGGRDVAKQAVAKLRELGQKIARLADAIDERMRECEQEDDDEIDDDDQEAPADAD